MHTSRNPSTVWIAPAPPPTITTPFPGAVSPEVESLGGRALLFLSVFCGFAVTKTLPSCTVALKEWIASNAGASSTMRQVPPCNSQLLKAEETITIHTDISGTYAEASCISNVSITIHY